MRAKATERSLVGRPGREVQLFVEGEGEARKASRGRPRFPLTRRAGEVPQGPLEASREGHGAVGKANYPHLLGGIGKQADVFEEPSNSMDGGSTMTPCNSA